MNSNEQQHQQQSKGFSKAVYQVFKKYLGHSPTSKSCLEYQEALFINSYQSNIAEVRISTRSLCTNLYSDLDRVVAP